MTLKMIFVAFLTVFHKKNMDLVVLGAHFSTVVFFLVV